MSFDSGFAQGRGIVQQSLDNIQRDKEFALRQAAADRDAEEFGLRKKDIVRRQTREGKLDALYNNGASADPYEDSAPGMVPQPQIAYDPVNPGGGSGPAVAMPGMRVAPPPRSLKDVYDLAYQTAQLNNDAAGMATALTNKRTAAVQSIQDMVGKMTPEERTAEFNRLNLDSANHINLYSLGTQSDSKGKPTGYTTLGTRNPDGSMTQFKLSAAEAMQLLTGAKLMEAGHGAEGSAMMMGINDKIDKIVTEMNASTLGMVNANNTARHNQVTGAAQTMAAGAAAQNAATEAKYKGLQGQMLQGDLDAHANAQRLVAQYQALPPTEQMGEKGRALEEQYRLLQNGPGKPFQQLRQPSNSGSAQVKYQTDNIWADIEKKLRGENTPSDQVEKQRLAFYEQRGFAGQAAQDAVYAGIDPSTGKKLTATDVDAFNRKFPNSTVNPTELQWLKGQTPTGLAPPAVRPPGSDAMSSRESTGAVNRNVAPITGKATYSVDGLRARFNSREEAQAASRKAGLGMSPMSATISKYGDD